MRRITIEFGERGREHSMFDVIDEYGRRCDGLAFDEMLGQVVSLAHPQIGQPRYRMLTEDEWVAYWGRRRALHRINKEVSHG